MSTQQTAWGTVEIGEVPPTERIQRFDIGLALRTPPGTVVYFNGPERKEGKGTINKIVLELFKSQTGNRDWPLLQLKFDISNDAGDNFVLPVEECWQKL